MELAELVVVVVAGLAIVVALAALAIAVRAEHRADAVAAALPPPPPAMTPARLAAFQAAWNERDADLVVSFMAEDCSYHASVGPELLGRSLEGREAVRAGVQEFFDRYPAGRFEDVTSFVAGERGGSEWTFVWDDPVAGERRVRGCDLFTFRGDLVLVKDAFRKQPA